MGSTSISCFLRLTVSAVIFTCDFAKLLSMCPIRLYHRTDNDMLSVMELRQLRYFVAVGEEQHYGRAEKRLRVAQPALSRQIQNLEAEIGFKLFERLPRGVKITAAGEFLLKEARRILTEINDATARAKRIACGQSGTLRVGFVQSISWQGIIPESLRHFGEHQPEAELQLKPLNSFEQISAVRAGFWTRATYSRWQIPLPSWRSSKWASSISCWRFLPDMR